MTWSAVSVGLTPAGNLSNLSNLATSGSNSQSAADGSTPLIIACTLAEHLWFTERWVNCLRCFFRNREIEWNRHNTKWIAKLFFGLYDRYLTGLARFLACSMISMLIAAQCQEECWWKEVTTIHQMYWCNFYSPRWSGLSKYIHSFWCLRRRWIPNSDASTSPLHRWSDSLDAMQQVHKNRGIIR